MAVTSFTGPVECAGGFTVNGAPVQGGQAALTVTAASGTAIAPGTRVVLFNNASGTASTIADASKMPGLLILKANSAGTHTVTITIGNWNGTNKIATFNALDETLYVYFDTTGTGTPVLNGVFAPGTNVTFSGT